MVPIHPGTMVLCVGSSERGIRGPGGLWPLARGLWPLASPETPGPGLECTTTRVVRDEC